MEFFLKAESAKTRDEWDRWYSAMMDDLLNKTGSSQGECLKIGAVERPKREHRGRGRGIGA